MINIAIDAFRLVGNPYSSHAIYIYELVKSLLKNDEIAHIYLIIPTKPYDHHMYDDLSVQPKVTFVTPNKKYIIQRFLHEVRWIQLGVMEALKNISAPIHYLICQYHQCPLRVSRQIKVVTIVHDLCGLNTFFYPRLKKGLYRHYTNFLVSLVRTDLFIPISEFTKSELIRIFPSSKSRVSKVVHNNLSIETVSDQVMLETLKRYDLQSQNYFFVFGNNNLRKGFDLAIAAYKIYKSRGGKAKFLTMAPKGEVEAIRKTLDDVQVPDVVLVAGISNQERDSLYKGSSALLFPSRCEGFGYPVLEAMMQGCPPIAWVNSPALEITNSRELLLQTLDLEEIVKSMFTYDTISKISRQQLSAKLINRAKEFMDFDFGKKFYESMVGMH
jgi:glycosyltransferase involved in cell wall biosynthesis